MDIDESPFKIKTSDDREFSIPAKVAEVSTFFAGLEKDDAVTKIDKIDGDTMAFLIKHLEAHDYKPPGVNCKCYKTTLKDNIEAKDYEVVKALEGMDNFEDVARYAQACHFLGCE